MKIEYKRIKIAMPHCGDCKEQLLGDGSLMSPFRCSCGEWKLKSINPLDPAEFTLNEPKQHE